MKREEIIQLQKSYNNAAQFVQKVTDFAFTQDYLCTTIVWKVYPGSFRLKSTKVGRVDVADFNETWQGGFLGPLMGNPKGFFSKFLVF